MTSQPVDFMTSNTGVAGAFSPKDMVRWLIAAAKAWAARRKAHRDYQYLLEVDPHLLSDIGVTTGDVQRAMRHYQ